MLQGMRHWKNEDYHFGGSIRSYPLLKKLESQSPETGPLQVIVPLNLNPKHRTRPFENPHRMESLTTTRQPPRLDLSTLHPFSYFAP